MRDLTAVPTAGAAPGTAWNPLLDNPDQGCGSGCGASSSTGPSTARFNGVRLGQSDVTGVETEAPDLRAVESGWVLIRAIWSSWMRRVVRRKSRIVTSWFVS
jgi:hypothetical protein